VATIASNKLQLAEANKIEKATDLNQLNESIKQQQEREVNDRNARLEIRRRLQQSYLQPSVIADELKQLTPNHTSIEALGTHYPKQRQQMVVADIILSSTINHTRPFVEQAS
jgi:hypothetical protein